MEILFGAFNFRVSSFEIFLNFLELEVSVQKILVWKVLEVWDSSTRTFGFCKIFFADLYDRLPSVAGAAHDTMTSQNWERFCVFGIFLDF
jgi:hypothetical protein